MFNTAFKGITTFSRNALFYGGICKWYYAKVEDVEEWPVVNPVTQEYSTQPVLREGAVWYGPVKVPDGSLGLTEVEKEIAAGTYFEIKIELTQPGDERNSRANLRNLGLHRYVAVAKTRAGGMYVVVGSPHSPLKLRREYSTGNGKNTTAGARFAMVTESIEPCIPLASFNGENSLPPVTGNPETLPPLPPATGANILFGTGVPSNATGNNGDIYINQAAPYNVYKKESGAWVEKGTFEGPQGDTGATGPQGPQGEAGLPAVNKAKRHAWQSTGAGTGYGYSYCATATYNSGDAEPDEDDEVWTITRLYVSDLGSILHIMYATNVNWTDYSTHTYTP